MLDRIVDIDNRLYELEATYVTDNNVDDKFLAIADDLDRVGDRIALVEDNLAAEVHLITTRMDTQRNILNAITTGRLLATVQGGNPTLAIAAIQKQELMQAQIDDLVQKDFFRGIQASNLERRLSAAESRRVLPATFGGLRGGMQIFVKTLTGKTITINDRLRRHHRDIEDQDPHQGALGLHAERGLLHDLQRAASC